MTHALPLPVHPTRRHPLTGAPLVAVGHSRRGPIWPILGGDDTVPPAGGTTTPPAGDPAPNTPPSGGSPAGGSTPPADAGKTFTQADLDRIIADRLKTEKTKFDQQLAEVQATAGKSDLEAAQIKAQAAEEKVTTITQASAQRIAATEAKLAAHLGGAKPDRLTHVVKAADLTDAVSEDGTVDEAKVAAAIGKVLEEFPEWKATTVPGSSGGELNPGGAGEKPTYTRAQVAAETKRLSSLPKAEADTLLKELNAAAAEGRIKG